MEEDCLLRCRMLLGDKVIERMSEVRVIIFGIGGVGSWCAESLIRTGVRHLTIVDGDCVCSSNINRQLMAMPATVGKRKTDVLRDRLLDICPEAEIDARFERFGRHNSLQEAPVPGYRDTDSHNSHAKTTSDFQLSTFDYIIDAIDSLDDKMLLIETACLTDAFFASSMGAALKIDPARIQVAPFDKVHGCPLAKSLRKRFRQRGEWPARPFPCVFSDETGANKYDVEPRANGSLMHVTASFGLRLAALVVQDIINAVDNNTI